MMILLESIHNMHQKHAIHARIDLPKPHFFNEWVRNLCGHNQGSKAQETKLTCGNNGWNGPNKPINFWRLGSIICRNTKCWNFVIWVWEENGCPPILCKTKDPPRTINWMRIFHYHFLCKQPRIPEGPKCILLLIRAPLVEYSNFQRQRAEHKIITCIKKE